MLYQFNHTIMFFALSNKRTQKRKKDLGRGAKGIRKIQIER